MRACVRACVRASVRVCARERTRAAYQCVSQCQFCFQYTGTDIYDKYLGKSVVQSWNTHT